MVCQYLSCIESFILDKNQKAWLFQLFVVPAFVEFHFYRGLAIRDIDQVRVDHFSLYDGKLL